MKLRGVVRWRVLVGQVVRVMWLHEGGAARVHVTWRCTRTSTYQYEYTQAGVHTGTSAMLFFLCGKRERKFKIYLICKWIIVLHSHMFMHQHQESRKAQLRTFNQFTTST